MYPIEENFKGIVSGWKRKFKCYDKKDFVVWGDFNSAYAQSMRIKFDMCVGHDYCKSYDEIMAFLRRKWLVIVYNEIRFNPFGYFEDSLTK